MAAPAMEALLQPGDAPLSLLEALREQTQPWRRDAACAAWPRQLFYPGRGQDAHEALAICGGCLVRSECLAYALEDPVARRVGVWGGTTARERRRIIPEPRSRGPKQ